MTHVYKNDLPEDFDLSAKEIAIDTETMGLNPLRDRLCLVQISTGDDKAYLVQLSDRNYEAPVLKSVLTNPDITKIFHFARFDMAVLYHYFGVMTAPIFCTKIASKLTRTYTDRHGLKDLCREILNIEISKQQQSSDWGADTLSQDQIHYAASDVLYLHSLKAHFEKTLAREDRTHLAQACFDFLPTRVKLDLLGWNDIDILSH